MIQNLIFWIKQTLFDIKTAYNKESESCLIFIVTIIVFWSSLFTLQNLYLWLTFFNECAYKRKPPTPWKFHEFFTLWVLLSFLSIIDSTLNWIMEDIKKHPCFRILLVSLFLIKHVVENWWRHRKIAYVQKLTEKCTENRHTECPSKFWIFQSLK